MLKQFIPNEFCLKCDVCCRFSQKNSVYAPKFLAEETQRLFYGDRFQPDSNFPGNLSPSPIASINAAYICQFFSPLTNTCSIYSQRPLDCQLYPLMITYDKEYENIILVMDKKCPHVQKVGARCSVPLHPLKGLFPFLVNLPHNFVMPYQPDTIKIATIKNLGGFKALALEHKPLFDEFLNVGARCSVPLHPLKGLFPFFPSTRSFANIYIWSDLFNILWEIVDDNLCVFYKYKNEFNMLMPPIAKNYLPPICHSEPQRGEESKREILRSLRSLRMTFGRIENIAADEIDLLKSCDVKIHKNTDEYIYCAKDLAELKGNKYASQRAAVNQFTKKYRPFVSRHCERPRNFGVARNDEGCIYRPFDIKDIDECLSLYIEWAWQRRQKIKNTVYQQLLDENLYSHRRAMLDYQALGIIGRVVEIDGKICAYTFGFKLNKNTYCIMLEVANLNYGGLAQFIYKMFAEELYKSGAEYINAMDDSGLENLKKTKLSWRPYKILSNYIAEVG